MSVFISGLTVSPIAYPRVRRTIVTPATEYPLSVQDAKAEIRQYFPDEDRQVQQWIAEATRAIENETGLVMLTQTEDVSFDGFPATSVLELPIGPVQSVTSVSYTDSAAAVNVWPSANYILIGNRLGLADAAYWPTDLRRFVPLVVRVVAGYTNVTRIPQDLLSALKQRFTWLAERRAPSEYEWLLYWDRIVAHKTVLVA